MQIKIIAKTEKGKKAIQQHVLEALKMKRAQKFALKRMGYSQSIISEKPYTLLCEMKGMVGSLMKPKHFIEEVKEALEKNGAIIDSDYIVEVQNG